MKKRSRRILAGTVAAALAPFLSGCEEMSEPVCVYGPPSYFGAQENAPIAEETPVLTPGSFDPENNIPVDVYGPPSYWENDEASPLEEQDPGADGVPFLPEENLPACVYGPPRDME